MCQIHAISVPLRMIIVLIFRHQLQHYLSLSSSLQIFLIDEQGAKIKLIVVSSLCEK